MKYPKIPKAFLKTEVELIVTSSETTMTGSPEILLKKKVMCNYQSANEKNSTEFERNTGVKAVIIVSGNIFKSDDVIPCGGSAVMNGVSHQIMNISLVRNPDGTINFTKITTR